MIRCPHCGCALRLVADSAADPPAAALDFDAPPAPDDGLPIARPRPIYRGAGADRERAWGAVVDKPVRPGERIRMVARSGRTWTATVAEALGAATGGHLVALRGDDWRPDPEPTDPPDPEWMHD